MANFIFARKTKEQNQLIIREINTLLRELAYDGRKNIKVRFRKLDKDSHHYVLDVDLKKQIALSTTIELQYNPFNIFWYIFSKKQIKEGTYLKHCRKSRYGGYTFY
ncbi:MAG: hypothetical protein K6B70_07460 [Clostridia bacterium]|nr:hypothetical protein [Clostridia bacterium]